MSEESDLFMRMRRERKANDLFIKNEKKYSHIYLYVVLANGGYLLPAVMLLLLLVVRVIMISQFFNLFFYASRHHLSQY